MANARDLKAVQSSDKNTSQDSGVWTHQYQRTNRTGLREIDSDRMKKIEGGMRTVQAAAVATAPPDAMHGTFAVVIQYASSSSSSSSASVVVSTYLGIIL